jgi:hypothetical protein
MAATNAKGREPETWEDLAEEVFTGMREWRVQHPRATFQEIETALDARLARVRARILSDVALQSTAGNLRQVPAAERPVCPDGGGPLVLAGREERVLTTSHEQPVPLVRSAAVCPACGRRVFPLDEELGLLPQVLLTPTLAESAVRLGI